MDLTLKLRAPLRMWEGGRVLRTTGCPSIKPSIHHILNTHNRIQHFPESLQARIFHQFPYASTMSQHQIPEKQWAQVIEKTGGPVDYKQIPGKSSISTSSEVRG